MQYIDIHSHLNFKVFEDDLSKVAEKMSLNDLSCINVGTKFEISEKALELANTYSNMYAIIGLHPIHTSESFHDQDEIGPETKAFTSKGEIFDSDLYEELIQKDFNKKIVGIGECGFDFFHLKKEDADNFLKQKNAFESQIDFAIKHDLPIMIHCRDAYAEVLETLEKKKHPNLRGNIHFFAGSKEEAQRFLDLNFTISFTGVITFVKDYADLVKFVPLDKIHAETDCPYVAPVPYRGGRNEPNYVIDIIKKMSEIKEIPLEELKNQLILNAKTLFNID